jgi:hypothetical protein
VTSVAAESIDVGGAFTDKATAGLVTLDPDAVILVCPAATEVANPVEDMVAAPVLLLFQFTVLVMIAVEPFEYVPVAVNCSVVGLAYPGATTIAVAGFGVTAMETSVIASVPPTLDVPLVLANTAVGTIMAAITAKTIAKAKSFFFIFLLYFSFLLLFIFPCFSILPLLLLIEPGFGLRFTVARTQRQIKSSQPAPYSSLEAMNTLVYIHPLFFSIIIL